MDPEPNSAYGHHRGEPLDESPAELEGAEIMFARRGCCCFWVPCFGSGQSSSNPGPGGPWERIGGGCAGDAVAGTPATGRWWKRALLKVREWSEIVAGPRWKTFIRRFRRNFRSGGAGVGAGGGGGGRLGGKKFQYDPLSYALNFDEGQNSSLDGDYGHRDFSARFAMPPSSAKSSMDLGGRDAPPLFAAT